MFQWKKNTNQFSCNG